MTPEEFVKSLYPEATCSQVGKFWVVSIPSLGLQFQDTRKRGAWSVAKQHFKPPTPQREVERAQAWESLNEWF